ncbi:MAG: DoxX family protein [Bacteroidetes bacterium]|nr:DoxX family protein [Bacteroidota bacterium]
MISFLSANKDLGLLIMRAGLGIMMVLHGWPKIIGGPDRWESLGRNTEFLGITFLPVFWGFMGALAEFLGGALLAAGFFARTAAFFLICTMIVAAATHLGKGDGLMGASHAIEVGFAFFGLLFLGPGKFALNQK